MRFLGSKFTQNALAVAAGAPPRTPLRELADLRGEAAGERERRGKREERKGKRDIWEGKEGGKGRGEGRKWEGGRKGRGQFASLALGG